MTLADLAASEREDLSLLTIAEAAAYLSISRGAVYNPAHTGALTSIHIGRARRIPMLELRRFVGSHAVAPTQTLRRHRPRRPHTDGRFVTNHAHHADHADHGHRSTGCPGAHHPDHRDRAVNPSACPEADRGPRA